MALKKLLAVKEAHNKSVGMEAGSKVIFDDDEDLVGVQAAAQKSY